jgi:hypothetical protein
MRPLLFVSLTLSVATLLISAATTARAARPARAQGDIPYVIVTDTAMVAEFAPLADAHAAAGLASTIRTLQSIRDDYPAGRDDAERVRLFLRDAHANWQTRFVLLGGDDPFVPARWVFLRLDLGASLPDRYITTDQYFACLTGDWNADGDSLWGETPRPNLGEPGDSVSFVPDLVVGRAPVFSPASAQVFVQKTLAAMSRAASAEPISVLLTGSGEGYPTPVFDLAVFSEQLLPLFTANPDNHVVRLYEFSANWPGSLPATRASVLDSLQRGYDLVTLYGPGGPGVFAAGIQPQDNITGWDLAALTNDRIMNIIALSAYTNQLGAGGIGVVLMNDPQSGAACVLGPVDMEFAGISATFLRDILTRIYGPGVTPADVPTLGEALTAAIVAFGTPNDAARLTTQGHLLLGDPALRLPGTAAGVTPVTFALASAIAEPGVVRLAWSAGGIAGSRADVERSTPTSAWTRVATVSQDGSDRFLYEDRNVMSGERYGYRLGVTVDGALRHSGEAWVTVPAAPMLALAGPRPNPAARSLTIAFSLAGAGPARLEVLDIAGRVVRAREVGALGAGPHTLDLTEGNMPSPGVYLVRLTQAGTSMVRRLCVIP